MQTRTHTIALVVRLRVRMLVSTSPYTIINKAVIRNTVSGTPLPLWELSYRIRLSGKCGVMTTIQIHAIVTRMRKQIRNTYTREERVTFENTWVSMRQEDPDVKRSVILKVIAKLLPRHSNQSLNKYAWRHSYT